MRACTIRAVIVVFSLVLIAGGTPVARAGKKQAGTLPAGGRTVGGPGALELAEGATDVLWSMQTGEAADVCLTVTVQQGPLQVRMRNTNGAVLRSLGLQSGEGRGICDEDAASAEFECSSPPLPAKRPITCRAAWRVDLIDADRLLTVQASIPGPGVATQSVVSNSALNVTCWQTGVCWSGVVSEDESVVLDAALYACFDAPCLSRAIFAGWSGCDSTGPGTGGPDAACTVKMNSERTVFVDYQ